MEELLKYLEQILTQDIMKIVISKPASKSEEYKKITIERKKENYQIAKYTEKQVFHENVSKEDLAQRCLELTNAHFQQINAWSETYEHMVMISKKGKCSYKRRALKAEERLRQPHRHRGTTARRTTSLKKEPLYHRWWTWESLPKKEKSFIRCMTNSSRLTGSSRLSMMRSEI